MDIRKPSEEKPESGNKGNKQKKENDTKFKTNSIQQASGKLIIPPEIQSKLKTLGSAYGIQFDLSDIKLDGTMAEKIKAMRKIVDMAEGDSKLLPEMAKLIKKLMRAEIKLAQFHKILVKQSIKHQVKMDKTTADVFLAMAGYKAKSAKLEHRTNVRANIIQKRSEKYQDYYENSVFGAESAIIDAEFEVLASNQKILSESKTETLKINQGRKQKINEYVQSALKD